MRSTWAGILSVVETWKETGLANIEKLYVMLSGWVRIQSNPCLLGRLFVWCVVLGKGSSLRGVLGKGCFLCGVCLPRGDFLLAWS